MASATWRQRDSAILQHSDYGTPRSVTTFIAGGQLRRAEFRSPLGDSAALASKVVINWHGPAAHGRCGRTTLVPVRGQIARPIPAALDVRYGLAYRHIPTSVARRDHSQLFAGGEMVTAIPTRMPDRARLARTTGGVSRCGLHKEVRPGPISSAREEGGFIPAVHRRAVCNAGRTPNGLSPFPIS